VSQFRTYGAGELVMDSHEEDRGCPRLYQRKYVDRDIPPEPRNIPMAMGSALHAALEIMERDDKGPEDALMEAWPASLSDAVWSVALDMLLRYVDRGGPMTKYATLGHEITLQALLYVDEVYGPVYLLGILDWIGVDLDEQSVLHVVDYKSNAAPPSDEAVRRDTQMKGYDWLAAACWKQLMHSGNPRIVVHLDALKYRDVEVRYTAAEREEWRDWAEAVARKILRDEEGKPHLNPGCTYCPVQHDCPKWLELPGLAKSLAMRRRAETPDGLWAQRVEFAAARKLLDDAVKAMDKRLEEELHAQGGSLRIGRELWQEDDAWTDRVDWRRLHEVLGDDVWRVVSTSKTAIERGLRHHEPSVRAAARACIERVMSGTKVTKTKANGA
jgi:CRISPR/Cas system-associated exonuclease Cas4 (RecB family)